MNSYNEELLTIKNKIINELNVKNMELERLRANNNSL